MTRTYPFKEKKSTFGFSKTDWAELNERLKNELGYSKIYRGYSIAFATEKNVVAELSEVEQYELQAKNREHFKEKVVAKLEKDKEQAVERVENSERLFREHNSIDTSTSNGFMNNLYSDTETANKTITDLNKLIDSFLV